LNEPLAIVGIACRLPGADGLEAFWNLVVEGRTAWGKLPESRLARDLYFHPKKSLVGKSYSEMGAVVSERPVDPAVCPITPEMLERFDVAHHIFLEVAALACRDAGMDPFAMPADRRTGVYVGHTGGSTRIGDIVYGTGIDEAAALLTEVEAARALLGPDASAEVAAEVIEAVRRRYPGRRPRQSLDLGAIGAAKIVQEALALDGPYLVVDAACASSLQAMAIGARALLAGGIDQAIVGGASYCKADSLVLFSAAQSVSNAGSCPFGAGADGLITAEGYVALVIKKLSRAVADGDRIRAVIRGLGVASDGKGKSLWAPREEGQALAVERAYPDSADIARIEYIEAHATSTQVGDVTELAALSRLMGRHLPPGRQIPIGSVKANIGHTLETAGIASLVKVVLAMEHGLIPPGTTCTELNAEFDWQGGPFRVPLEAVAWPAHADGTPRCAAVNAFGIGGLNVHVALVEHVPARPSAPPRADDAHDEPIAIVGAGCVLPGGLSLDAFYDRLDRGETAIGPVPPDRWQAGRVLDRAGPRTWHTTAGLGGFVRGFAYDWRRHKVPPKQIAAANPLQFMFLEAADAAIADAGGLEAGLDRIRTGVVVGTLFGGDFANQLQIGLRLPETGTILRESLQRRGLAAADVDRVVVGYEKKVLEKLPALVDETGSFTSSTLASRLTKTFDLMGGALALDSGDCSSVSALSAAVDMLRQRSCDAVICAAGERSMDLMAYEGRSLGGFLAAEPRSVLDGHTSGGDVPGEGAVVLVLKRLADARAAGDSIRGVIRGVSVGSGRSVAEVSRRVIREAVERAAVAPAAVRVVEVAVAAGGEASADELAALGGSYAVGGQPPVAGSLDGLIGHPGAAAGAAAILKLSRSLASGFLPGSVAVHVAQTHGLAAPAAATPIPAVDAAGYRAGCVTVMQDAQVGHVVLDNGLPVPEAARPRAAAGGISPAIAAAPAPRAGGRPLVAAIFPGQGSQYTDMFRCLAAETPEARAVLGRLDSLARACGQATLAEIAWRPDNGLGTRIWDTQWGMYLGDLLAWGVLQDMGFAPDLVASHSFGEFPSLAAVGAWSLEDGCRATQARAAAVERHGPRNGAMLSVIADRATVRRAIEPFAGQVWVCAENAPEQSVIGGAARIVDAVEVMLEVARVKSKRLAVPSPFHTPLLAAAADELAATIRGLRIIAPRVTTFSSTTATPLETAAEIQQSLIRQMTETVRWVDVVERLYAAGARTFVEVGPCGVLTGLTRRILEGRAGVAFLQFDQRGRAPREHLARLREQLAAAGALAARGTSHPVTVSPGSTAGTAETFAGRGASRPAATAQAAAVAQPMKAGRVVSFDATARRRERNRSGGAPRHAARAAAAGSAPMNDTGLTPAVVLRTNHDVCQPTAAVAVTESASDGQIPEGPDAAEIEAFLIDFVVEQTGYPREIVELGADLEADLGIDSIRKAQLFGEIGQKYGLTADDSVSLDEFPTLRHLLEYMLPRVAAKRGGPMASMVQPSAFRQQSAHSAAYARGLERGRDHAAAIAAWARQVVATGVAADAAALEPAVEEELAGVAAGAGVEPGVVRAAFAEPARPLGGCDALIVAPAEVAAARAVIVCLGRHADPAIRTFETHGLRGRLVGVKGLPGAVFGWNDTGLVAVAAQTCDGAATLVCEQLLTTCRSIDEAERAVGVLARPPHGLVVAAIAGGGFEVVAGGRLQPIAAVACRADGRAPLARVLLADGARTAASAAADLLRAVPGVRDALAATCGWISIGVVDGRVAAIAGGPGGADWAPAATDLGPGWESVAAAQAATVVSARKPAMSRADVTRRYGLVLREAVPLTAGRRLAGERVLVVNGGPLVESFIAAIRAVGGTPIVVECGSADEAIVAVEQAEESGAVRHLVVVAARADGGDWLPARDRSVIAAFFACQRWLVLRGKAGDVAAATLTGVTGLGGDFGLAFPIGSPAGGAIAGLLKGVAREFAGLHVRVLDAAVTLPAADVAAAAVAEMQDGAGPVETALVDGRRMNVVPCDTPPRATTPLAAVAAGSGWIVTGGARGVTAECCRELGRRHGLRLALVGSTAPVAVEPAWLGLDDAGRRDLKSSVMLEAKARGEEPRAAWRRIEKSIEIERSLGQFRAAGVDARYYACNLTDAAGVRAAVGRITADIGPVRGIVHGAGFEAACRFEKKTLEGLEATLGPKCAGLEHLLAAVDPATLEAVIAFGSTSGRLGGHGQADYSLANDMLAKIIGGLRQRRPHLRGTVFHWHAWDEVGMASRPESRFVLERFGLKFMPRAEGVRRFMDEIEAGLPDAEVLVTEPAMCPDAVGGPTVATAAATHRGSLVAGVEPRGAATWVKFALDPTRDRFLLEHKQFGRPLLPAVMGAELIAQAAAAAGAGGGEIRDFAVERPIGFPVDQPREIRVEVGPAGAGRRAVRGWTGMLNGEGRTAGEDRVHVSGVITAGPVEPIAATLDEPPFPYNPMVYQDDGPMWHGPTFRTLTGLFFDRSGGWGRLVAPDADVVAGPRGAAGWTVPVATLDGCIVACAVYSYILCGRRVEVPVRFDRLRIAAQPQCGETCTVRMRFRSQDQRDSVYDLVLFGADGRPLLALDGLHLAVMGPDRSRLA